MALLPREIGILILVIVLWNILINVVYKLYSLIFFPEFYTGYMNGVCTWLFQSLSSIGLIIYIFDISNCKCCFLFCIIFNGIASWHAFTFTRSFLNPWGSKIVHQFEPQQARRLRTRKSWNCHKGLDFSIGKALKNHVTFDEEPESVDLQLVKGAKPPGSWTKVISHMSWCSSFNRQEDSTETLYALCVLI